MIGRAIAAVYVVGVRVCLHNVAFFQTRLHRRFVRAMWLEWMRHGAQPCGRNKRARQGGGANPPTYGHAVSQHFALNGLQWRVCGKFGNSRTISPGRLLQ